MVELAATGKEASRANDGAPRQSFVLGYSMADWEAWKGAVPAKQCLMPDRSSTGCAQVQALSGSSDLLIVLILNSKTSTLPVIGFSMADWDSWKGAVRAKHCLMPACSSTGWLRCRVQGSR